MALPTKACAGRSMRVGSLDADPKPYGLRPFQATAVRLDLWPKIPEA